MIDIEGCVKQWYEEDTVSERMEALLLAIEDECLATAHTVNAGIERLMSDIQRDTWRAFERVNTEKRRTA